MDDEILQLFLEDTREHLADIETDLLDLEEAGVDADPELVNKVFRTAHSIKGSAGFLGLDNIRDLAHKIENVLDMMRAGETAPSSEIINIILRAFDMLQSMVDNINESETVDVSEHLKALTSVVEAGLPQEARPSLESMREIRLPDGQTIFTISEHNLNQAKRGGNFIYMVEFDLIHDVHKKGRTPLDLLRFLEKSGYIVDCRTDIAVVGDLFDEPTNRIPFFILYATILEPDGAKQIFQVKDHFVYEIDSPDMQSHAATEPLPAAEPEQPKQTPKVERTDSTMVENGECWKLYGEGDSAAMVFEGSVGIGKAKEIKVVLLKALESFDKIALDLQKVDESDVTFLQILLAASISAKKRGVELSRRGELSPALADLARRAGFSPATAALLGSSSAMD